MSAVDEYGWFVGGIEGFGTIHAVSLNIPGFNLFVGADSIVSELTPEYVPVSRLDTRLHLKA